jgi:hypothetical protein
MYKRAENVSDNIRIKNPKPLASRQRNFLVKSRVGVFP